jgi:hypothetical protein
MNDDITLPPLASCRTLQIGAKYPGGIHLALCLWFHNSSLPDGRLTFQETRQILHQLEESYRTERPSNLLKKASIYVFFSFNE